MDLEAAGKAAVGALGLGAAYAVRKRATGRPRVSAVEHDVDEFFKEAPLPKVGCRAAPGRTAWGA